MTRAVLSVDLEWWEHTPAYRSASGSAAGTAIGREAVHDILDALDAADATATFFTVSAIADDDADLLQSIADAGHEIASHTHTHEHLTDLSPERRRSELLTSRERLEAATGTEVTGFRAPSFDFGDDHFDLLAETGYDYDSSVVPCRSIPGWYGGEFDLTTPAPATAVDPAAPATLAEVPVAVMPRLGLPLTGTWIRFFSVRYTLLGMRWLARRGVPPVLYVHPWELTDLPDVEGVPGRVYFRSGTYMRRAVRRILDTDFEFVPTRDLAAEAMEADR